jgi:plasmid stability protein
MPDILVRGLRRETVERLKRRAKTSGRSLQQEVRTVLERSVSMLTAPEMRRLTQSWHRRLAGRTFSDSADLIREDRDAR